MCYVTTSQQIFLEQASDPCLAAETEAALIILTENLGWMESPVWGKAILPLKMLGEGPGGSWGWGKAVLGATMHHRLHHVL